MLPIGRFRAGSCSGVTRRAFLEMAAAAPLGLSLAGNAAGESAVKTQARSVIFIWLWGAPSHLDTFDPKPDAPSEYRGPFSPIATRTAGLQFTELLPQLASRSDKFSIIRSNVSFAPGHPDAGTFGLTGFAENPEPPQPNFGSIIAKHRGQRGTMPPFIALGRGIPKDVVRIVKGYGGGTLGKTYDPFQISCSDQGEAEIPSLSLLSELTPGRLSDRRTLLTSLDKARRELDAAAATDAWDQMYDRAYQLLTKPEARAALDLSQEDARTRAAYGQTSFGQSCLLARRLVEARVPYIQVNWSEYVEAITPNTDFGWDTHINNFEFLQDRHCPIFDRAMSALLDDLGQRGLLSSTLVVAMGEFGRTPKINSRAARDHWPRCYSSLWAGAGVGAGRVIGASDERAEDPVTMPITPLMVGTTISHLAGMDTQARAEMNVLAGGTVIHDLLA